MGTVYPEVRDIPSTEDKVCSKPSTQTTHSFSSHWLKRMQESKIQIFVLLEPPRYVSTLWRPLEIWRIPGFFQLVPNNRHKPLQKRHGPVAVETCLSCSSEMLRLRLGEGCNLRLLQAGISRIDVKPRPESWGWLSIVYPSPQQCGSLLKEGSQV